MADTTYTDFQQPAVNAAWLNDVNAAAYRAASAISGSASRTAVAKFADTVSLKDFGTAGTGGDDTTVFTIAVNAAASLGATLLIPRGSYRLNSLAIPSNTHIKGEGIGKTVLNQISGANDLMHTVDPGSASSYTSNILIEDLTMQGTVAADGFQEVLHLFFTQGASDLVIQRCAFIGPRGDAVYIGTGNERGQNPTLVRHNKNVRVLDCFFDGVIKDNRNGISVIDCDGFWAERNYFTRLSRSNMPGPIDIEPDGGGSPAGVSGIIRDINILFNKFYDNAGQSAGVAVNLPNNIALQTVPVYGINIIGNDVDTSATTYGAGLSFNAFFAVTSRPTHHLGIKVAFNTVKNCYSPFLVRGLRGVDFSYNNFGPSTYSAEIGDSGSASVVYDISFTRNLFNRVANDNVVGGNAVFLYGADNVAFVDNHFDSCGKANNTYNANLVLSTATLKSNIRVEDNTFYSPVVNANAWDVRVDAGTLGVGTIRHARNKLINLTGGTVGFVNDFFAIADTQAPVLANAWVNFGGNHQDVGFWKDSTGMVHLRGTLKNGTTTAGTTILSIPAGFRPGKIIPLTASALNGVTYFTAYLQIENTIGDLQIAANLAGNTMLSLNNISWKAEA